MEKTKQNKTKRVSRKKTKLTPITLGEFKTWLDGYCSAQEDTWTPSLEQWELIKNKFFSIEEEKLVGLPPQLHQTNSYDQQYGGQVYTQLPQNNATNLVPQRIAQPPVVSQHKPPMVVSEKGNLRTTDSESGEPSAFI